MAAALAVVLARGTPFRSAARMIVEPTDGFEVVGKAETGEDGAQVAGTLTPDPCSWNARRGRSRPIGSGSA